VSEFVTLARRFFAASAMAVCSFGVGVLLDRRVALAGPSPCPRPFITTAARPWPPVRGSAAGVHAAAAPRSVATNPTSMEKTCLPRR